MIRLFVAIQLPETVRERLASLCTGVPGARWTPAENMHLTLRFIGEVGVADAGDMDHALTRVQAPGFTLAFNRVDSFGSKGKARAIWAGVSSNPALEHLHDKIESALVRAGLPPEGRKFVPHVTLARLKSVTPARAADYLEGHGPIVSEPVAVREFTLFSSFLASSGAIHTVEAVYPLDGD